MAIATYEGNEPYIFVSYAHKNNDVVVPIIEALANNGFRVWYDAGIEAGTEWPEYVAEKLVGSAVVIAFISKAALESQNCRREINFAISRKKDILSVYIEDVTLTLGMEMQLSTTQAMFHNRLPYEAFLQKLMVATILAPCRCAIKAAVTAPKPVASPLSDFEIENGVLKKYVGKSSTVVIPDSVTSIGENAFSGCSSLTSITIPNSVTSIDSFAFYGCSGLTSITIPDSVTSIGESAFSHCKGLTSITIPDSVTSIGRCAFSRCLSLKSLMIPNSVTSIGEWAFRNCSSLASITIPDGVTSIGEGAFDGCLILTSITIPNSVTSIGESAFDGCSSLTSITIPGSLTSIGARAFYKCSGLTRITIPDSVTRIGPIAFSECKNLTVYCQASSKPDGWADNWNPDNRPVVWGWKG